MEVPPGSSSGSLGSLTTRSTESMELDGFEQDTPAEPSSPIIVDVGRDQLDDAPSPEYGNASAISINPDDEEIAVAAAQPKRKRTSINYNVDDALNFDDIHVSPSITGPIIKRSKTLPKPNVRGVIIGVWRDSNELDVANKHVVFGFIDIHDRLRTRIYGMNRKREELVGNLPTGAGGCWVTFPKIIFDSHLKDLSPGQVKEYVKFRVQDLEDSSTEERSEELNAIAVGRAKAAVADGIASPASKQIVHRPSGRKSASRQSFPPQTLRKTPSFQAINSPNDKLTKGSFYDGKPTGVLLGYWVDSNSPLVEDKHAMYGVISGHDCLRVKVQRVTRDGRYVDGNFPVGAGAMWLNYDKVVFEPHLADLTRQQMKEYTRIRLSDLAQLQDETDQERKLNEAKAVAQAKEIAARDDVSDKAIVQKAPTLEMETRHSARSEQRSQAKQQAEANAEVERTRKQKKEASEKQHKKTQKEISLDEASAQGAAQVELKNNMKKLNRIWKAQQTVTTPQAQASTATPPPPPEEVKYHNGIKYERKQTGVLQGKLVSAAQILNIDGEDYIEYRVLMRPAF
ncbi:hypothetical protein GLAREA_01603 [Glarea lozoyensis ATCC 20868]|uniref:Uncharacterized protein n=1 Tax=Glarea lozoyensis (strain ATCC 20868 / MF5171) TaxID=1116229 RepID=S3D0Y9_GLAL2|nr:uncharacterized protein GLAREA_01603 [Glarea lozoyensis ATCC 20868]EPE25691.1 hypothetical protein GLAREA_01603 [Glarea lozoyensis ATCC 20868]